MEKLNNKYENFHSALQRLNEANVAYHADLENDLYRDALIQRFEFTFELAWKTLREFLIAQGYRLDIVSPKGVFAFAFQEGIIQNEAAWLDMLESRNLTSHAYRKEQAQEIAEKIHSCFCGILAELEGYIAEHLS